MPSLAALARSISGPVFSVGQKGYGAARQGGGSTLVRDRSPRAVVQPADATDIGRVIEYVRHHGLPLSIRGGGHDMLGASTVDGGILLDLCRLSQVSLDAKSHIARVGGGTRSGALVAACAKHALAPVLGMSPNVGIGGLALGGGIGWLSGRLGATVDHVLSVDLVLADGSAVTASADERPDLFWAVRGGGGNFGVATGFTMRVHPVDDVLAGELHLDAGPGRLLPLLREFLVDAGDPLDIGTSFSLGPDPTAVVELCWSGDPDAGERLVDRLRRVAPVLHDSVRRKRFARFAGTARDESRMILRGTEFDGLDDAVVDAVADAVAAGGPDGCSIGLLHYMHGALTRVPKDATPFVRPEGHILCNIVAPHTDREHRAAKTAWTVATWESLKRASSDRTYPNYLCDDSEPAVRAAYGDHYARLQAIKRRHDPDNLFRGNRNIRPV